MRCSENEGGGGCSASPLLVAHFFSPRNSCFSFIEAASRLAFPFCADADEKKNRNERALPHSPYNAGNDCLLFLRIMRANPLVFRSHTHVSHKTHIPLFFSPFPPFFSQSYCPALRSSSLKRKKENPPLSMSLHLRCSPLFLRRAAAATPKATARRATKRQQLYKVKREAKKKGIDLPRLLPFLIALLPLFVHCTSIIVSVPLRRGSLFAFLFVGYPHVGVACFPFWVGRHPFCWRGADARDDDIFKEKGSPRSRPPFATVDSQRGKQAGENCFHSALHKKKRGGQRIPLVRQKTSPLRFFLFAVASRPRGLVSLARHSLPVLFPIFHFLAFSPFPPRMTEGMRFSV